MADVRPFSALRYSPALAPSLADVLTPPYDVISPGMQSDLLARHPKNLIRIDLSADEAGDNETENRYTRAGRTLAQWIDEGTLVLDAEPALYVYEQEFSMPDGARIRRRGFFAAVRIENFEDEGGIKAHERTFEGPKADRLRLTRATQCNLSPIFSIYDDPEGDIDRKLAEVAARTPDAEAVIDGIAHRLWIERGETLAREVAETLADKPLYIADGHHRYETSINYRRERRAEAGENAEASCATADAEAPFDFTLMFLANMHGEGMEILPTYRMIPTAAPEFEVERILESLAEHFEIELIGGAGDDTGDERGDDADPDDRTPRDVAADLVARLAASGADALSLVMLTPDGRARMLRLRPGADPTAMIPDPDMAIEVQRLDVSILHRFIFDRVWLGSSGVELGHDDIAYIKDAAEVIERIRGDEFQAAFLLNPTRMEQVCEVAGLGMRMPQKSTYFYPKVITGMVIRMMGSGGIAGTKSES